MKKVLNIYSAPMAGITDKPFRQILRKFSDAPIFTEMIGVETLIHMHPKTQKMLQIQDEQNIIVQLVGANPDSFAMATKMIENIGAVGIDINMGCPVKKLIQNCSGAELMRHAELAARLIESVKNHTTLPVSVKTRLGWHSSNELKTFSQVLINAGVDQIEIHARTKEMGFSGLADWQAVGNCIDSISTPIIINGDIVNYETAQEAMKLSHAQGVMIGRSLLGRPWKLFEIATNSKIKYNMADIILEHFDLMLSYYGKAGLFAFRKHLAWYAKNKKNVAAWREKMYLIEDVDVIKKMIVNFF